MLRDAPVDDLFPELLGSEPAATPDLGAPDLDSYQAFLVAFSGGKDSLACVLHLLEAGADPSRIELWHHDVDGRESDGFMDWPVTRDYCRAVAAALGVKIYFSWREGGFLREMLRDGQRTAPIRYETPDGSVGSVGGVQGPLGTRRKFPQVSADLSVRWCSSSLKIEVGAGALRNQARFDGARTLFISGERGEESPARSRYAMFEPHRSDRRDGGKKRHVDHWRPLRDWSEKEVWALIERHRIAPHPAYELGWGRASCAGCIFGSANQWASFRAVAPEMFERIARYEEEFGITIQRKSSVREMASRGRPYQHITSERITAVMSDHYLGEIRPESWMLPAGAFGESCGPR